MKRKNFFPVALIALALFLAPKQAYSEEGIWPKKVKVGGEFRVRLESQINYDFDNSQPDSDTFVLIRTRVYLDAHPVKNLRLFAMFQDSETLDQTTALIKTPTRHQFYQGFLYAKNDLPLATSIKGGRQELIYGDQRLIAIFDWGNLGRSFDGAVLRLENDDFWIDLFGTRIQPPNGLEQ